jgi:hypothetical protein
MSLQISLSNLPSDLQRNILSYIEYPKTPSCKAIIQEISIYNWDNNWIYTKQANMYLICNIMSFSEYYFDKREYPYDYLSSITGL